MCEGVTDRVDVAVAVGVDDELPLDDTVQELVSLTDTDMEGVGVTDAEGGPDIDGLSVAV